MRSIGRILLSLMIFLSVAALCGCSNVKVYEASTGSPVKNYEVTVKTPSESEPVIAQFYIVRMVNKGKYQYDPEYCNILKEMVINHFEAQRTMSLRMVIRILNPTGLRISLTYRTQSLTEEDKDNWVTKDEVVYSGNERDLQRSIDCPMTTGQHETGLWVYRDKFLLFEFANFKYEVE
jgi:hypothetical protein